MGGCGECAIGWLFPFSRALLLCLLSVSEVWFPLILLFVHLRLHIIFYAGARAGEWCRIRSVCRTEGLYPQRCARSRDWRRRSRVSNCVFFFCLF